MTDQTPKTPRAKRSAKQPKLTVVGNKNTGTKTKERDRVSARSANDKVETEDKTERDAATIKSELQAKLDRLMG